MCIGGRGLGGQPMAQALWSRTARLFAALLNSIFLISSICLIVFSFFAAMAPPKADISPEPVSSYPQYIVTLVLITSYSICLFLLTMLGMLSLCILNSFLISVHILGQIAMISAQLIAIAFTITVRKRVHTKLSDSWRGSAACLEGEECAPLARFLHSEALLIVCLCVFLVLQIMLLIASGILAEGQSSEERHKMLELQRETEDDE